ncbi:LCN15 protein, partial [Penelope pileata]|nr:LCN15 protein [Penelope pileata]
MAAVLPSLALALLCLLCAGAEVPVQHNFNAEKFAGTWHMVATVSNCPVFLSTKDKMTSSITTVSFTPEGHMTMDIVLPLPGECKKVKMLFQHTGQAGHYTGTGVLEEKQEKRDMRVVDTDYEHYAIVYLLRDSGREPSTTLQLYTRKQDMSPQLLQKFKELFLSMGLTADMLAILPHSGECQ